MSTLDVDGLLQPVSSDTPCGEDLSYDPAYTEIERAMQGTPERQVGEAVVQAEEPEWRSVRKKCVEVLKRTKDLRIAVDLALAMLQTERLDGFRDGLSLIAGLIEMHWDGLHPQLDPEDDNDPLERMNIIASLGPQGSFQDPLRFPQRLLDVTLCSSPQMGRFSMRSVMQARGELVATGDASAPELAQIDAAFATANHEELVANASAIVEIEMLLEKIGATLMERVGPTRAPDLSNLETPVRRMRQLLEEKAPEAFPGASPSDEGAAGDEAKGGGVGTVDAKTAGAQAGASISGEVTSRDDVIKAFDKICAYYKRFEPSSPVPLLVRRAKGLVKKGFTDIIKDLTPDAIKQIELIGGPGGEADG